MRNITFRAGERLIDAARERARREGTTLIEALRASLEAYVGRGDQAEAARMVIEDLRAVVASGGRRFPRDEMHER